MGRTGGGGMGFIGSLSILLVTGLSAPGLLDRLNGMISYWVGQEGKLLFPKSLPDGFLWLTSAFFAFGLAWVILNVPGTWQRWVLWLTTVVLIVGWVPVLGLAAYAPQISGTFIAALWSGVCAMVYAGNHRMPCEGTPETDVLPLERSGAFRGRYHCLGGKLSPLDRVSPEDLRIPSLIRRIEAAPEEIEVILALGSDVEGEATANYLADLLRGRNCRLTRIAQ